MPKKHTVEDTITCELHGKIYSGHRVIKGTIRKVQTIFYNGKSKERTQDYPRQRQHLMDVDAIQLLIELIKENEDTNLPVHSDALKGGA
jgi:hypothetical protein